MSLSDDQYETESEESYFVSMTDIMVGMFFVFIILLMYFVFGFKIRASQWCLFPSTRRLRLSVKSSRRNQAS